MKDVIAIMACVVTFIIAFGIGGFCMSKEAERGVDKYKCISDEYFVIQKIEQIDKLWYLYTIKHMDNLYKLKSTHQYNIGDSLKIIK